MKRPVLSIQTIYFHESGAEEARRFGLGLYERLTRPVQDPLGNGPGIPVRIAVRYTEVDPDAAETTVLVPMLGNVDYLTMANEVIAKLKEWHAHLKPGHVLPVPLSENWRARESEMPGKPLLTMLYGKDDRRARTLDEIVLAVARIWTTHDNQTPVGVKLFISHSKADLTATGEAATKIHNFVVTDGTGRAFFDANDLYAGEATGEQLDEAAGHGVLISIRGDSYGSRAWCQRELLRAKLRKVPTLTVEILKRGELRSFPYGGNGPSVVWDDNPARVASMAMVEWLRAAFFQKEAARIIEAADLPDDVCIVARPPELLDLAQGPLRFDRAQLVLHPDPELSVLERRVLKAARPRMHLATPTTAFRRLLSRRDETADVSSPLEGRLVAMSLSDSPDENGPAGFTHNHTVDATVYVARTLISCGAAIAYGGDFRQGGYTELLANLIQTYNQTATKRAQDLHSFLAASIPLKDAPDSLPLVIHHLKETPVYRAKTVLPPPPVNPPVPPALYFSEMRQMMEDDISARVILGGNSVPKTEQGPGYGGRYPGVVEEAWCSLSHGKPLYVIGGFGGAARIVADLMQGRSVPFHLQDATWATSAIFTANAKTIEESEYTLRLGLPKTMAELASAITRLALPHLESDAASLAWNGLSVEENKLLLRTQDPVTIAAYVSKGLLYIARKQDAGLFHIEVVNDSIGSADNLDAIAIATVDGVPLGGAGAALDHLTGGTASHARSRGRSLASLKDSPVDADWLYLASLGKPSELGELSKSIEKAAEDTATIVAKHGFQRIGLVTFGGNLNSDAGETARAMIAGFKHLDKNTALVWYETDKKRFDALREALEHNPNVKLTTRRALAPVIQPVLPPEPLILTVRLVHDELSVTLLPPSAGATVAAKVSRIPAADLDSLSAGKVTPSLAALSVRGKLLANYLFGDQAAETLDHFRESRMIVVHDIESSRVPFEMLSAGADLRPALAGGITRKLSVAGLGFERQIAKPAKKGSLRVLLVANPTGDLPGAGEEAKVVKSILESLPNVELLQLHGAEATKARVAQELEEADILHFCGHAYFRGTGDNESGLILADKELTAADLRQLDPLPRMAFVNACEAGRVRGKPTSNAAAFAELFLRSGVDAYLGTFWEVGDAAASLFAEKVYTSLAQGTTLEAATLAGRNALFTHNLPDWANYMLFGGGYYRLVSES